MSLFKRLPVRHITKISDLSRAEISGILALAADMKKTPSDYYDTLKRKTLLMLFEKPSLRTRVSLETGMTQMGGHAIAYMTGDSPIGQKESYEDTGAVLSRMVDAATARVKSREQIAGLAANSTIPIVNALDDWAHPMQMLADLQTISERTGCGTDFEGLSLAFVGDVQNNVTYDLMRIGCLMGMHVRVAGPDHADFHPDPTILQDCDVVSQLGGGTATVYDTAEEAVDGADFVYADSWLSYGIPADQKEERLSHLMPYQVTSKLMRLASPKATFLNCLPAIRGEEQTADVLDGPQSVVFQQAENRLHAQKSLLHSLLTFEIHGGAPVLDRVLA